MEADGGEPLCQAVCSSDPAPVLPQPLFVFEKDGQIVRHAVCQECVQSLVGDTVQRFFDRRNGLIRQDQLAEILEALAPLPTVTSQIDESVREAWPSVPLGVAIWALCSSREVAPLVKAWVTATVDIAVRLELKTKTFCPNHPDILYPSPLALQTLNCPHCHLMFCMSCRSWHEKSRNCEAHPVGTRHCPFCQLPGIKISGCDHISCQCGKHWCWVCGTGCNTGQDVQDHIHAAHRGK
jgi:hypothetical protein